MRTEGDNIIIDLRTAQTDIFAKPETIEFFPEEWGIIHNSAPVTATRTDTGLTVVQKRGERALGEVPVSKAVLTYEDAQGERKAVRVSILSEGGEDKADNTLAAPDLALWQAAMLALLGGLILNLMPCVFPVLSLKALSLAKLGDKERAHARGYGVAYTLGILVSFAVIAGGLMALQAAGSEIGWGFQLQNPAVILGLIYLLFLMGLNLSGYFELSGGWTNIGSGLVQKQGYSGSFFTGVLATLVATPCTAPFMGVAMGFALTQPPLQAMTVFMAMGLGLALPYLLLCFIPWLRKFLPRPGAWMDLFKQFLAFPMFLSSAWLVWVLAQQTDAITVFYALIGIVSLALIIWLVRHWPSRAGVKIVSGALILVSVSFILMTLMMPHPEKAEGALSVTTGDQNWESFTQSRLDQLLAQGDPVFVNMTAAWCITCKVNDNVAINVESTRAFFAEKGIRYLKGDWTNQNPEITKYLSAYGRSGVPIYVFYPARDENTGERPKEIILPQILTPAIVTNSLSGANVSE
jgi:thiol:disulfide interchange protein DsbD